MAPINVALVGGGIFVKGYHLPAVLECKDLVLKAIFSRSLKSAQDTADLITDKSHPAPELYASDAGAGRGYEDLLKRSDISGLIVALPIANQPDYIVQGLDAGKHVLAEKPIAKDVASAKKLLERAYAAKAATGATFAIAENHRFMPQHTYAAEQIRSLGPVSHFSFRAMSMVQPDNMYFQVSWRAKPEHQGGFLLDAGVHEAAFARLLLGSTGPEGRLVSVHAHTLLAQPHLGPIDTVTGILLTSGGASGVFQRSMGTRLSGGDFELSCQDGSLTISGETVTVKKDGAEETKRDFKWTSGVAEEVAAWGAARVAGEENPLLAPEEALADLELMELMFRSGEQGGAEQKLELQKL